MLPLPYPRRRRHSSVAPRDFVAEVVRPKHAVHQHPQITVRVVVAVDVDAARRLQHAAALDQAHGHKRDVRRLVLCRGRLHRLHHLEHRRVVVLDPRLPRRMHIRLPLPDVLDAGLADAFVMGRAVRRRERDLFVELRGRDGGLRPAGEGFVGGEGRVNGDEVYALVVDGAQEPEVVHYGKRSRLDVQFAHRAGALLGVGGNLTGIGGAGKGAAWRGCSPSGRRADGVCCLYGLHCSARGRAVADRKPEGSELPGSSQPRDQRPHPADRAARAEREREVHRLRCVRLSLRVLRVRAPQRLG